MARQEGYSPRNRAERVISAGRLFLAVLIALAVLLDSPRALIHPSLLLVLTIGYLAYSAGLTILTWTRQVTTRAVPIVTHVIDLLLFAAFLFLTNGAYSPYFPYLVFATICGAIRWHGRGALITGAASLVLYMATTLGTDLYLGTGEFHLGQFVTRCAQLALVAALLGYLRLLPVPPAARTREPRSVAAPAVDTGTAGTRGGAALRRHDPRSTARRPGLGGR